AVARGRSICRRPPLRPMAPMAPWLLRRPTAKPKPRPSRACSIRTTEPMRPRRRPKAERNRSSSIRSSTNKTSGPVMNHFDYRNGVLHAEAVNLHGLAEAVGTPFYCYSTATLERHYRVFTGAFAGEKAVVCYAMKANSNQSVLRTLAKLGAGADVVSGGELKRALAAGIPPRKILFSGVGKTEAELRAALAADILCINVESEPELELLSRLATETGTTARISVRVNPDVDAGTHAKISTGKSENKFGIPLPRARAVYARAAQLPGLKVVGTDMHIGSQITDLGKMETAYRILSDFVHVLRADGHKIAHIDFGGGLGIPYYRDREALPGPDAY